MKILRSQRSLAVVAGMKKTNDHAELTKVEFKKMVTIITDDRKLRDYVFSSSTIYLGHPVNSDRKRPARGILCSLLVKSV